MGEVVSLNAARPVPHATGPVICAGCRHSWIGVFPVPLRYDMECPACATNRGVPQLNFDFEGDTARYTCSCGWQIFSITANSVLCIACGAQHDPTEVLGVVT